MASISTDREGNRRICFTGPNRKRRTIYLGPTPMKAARTVQAHVENLLTALLFGRAPDPDTAEWVGSRDNTLHNKLAAVGLVQPRKPTEEKPEENKPALGNFLDNYIGGRTDLKPGTLCNFNLARRNLLKYFGANRPLDSITPGDTDDFRVFMLRDYAENTVRRACGRAKQFFGAALRKRLISENPFADMKGCAVKAVKDREYYVTREEAGKVLEACPDAQWRLLFALSRYGGLRCPSEHLALRWTDVDWERNRITVHSPKTEHHEGKESREIPIFPELRPYLEEVWDQAEPGTEYVITRYRCGNANLRTQFQRIIRRAGLKPWPKPFHNLRGTRETELTESFPVHVVAAWIGNTVKVALKHYLQVRDEDFDRAAGVKEKIPEPETVAFTDARDDARRAGNGETATRKPTRSVSAVSRRDATNPVTGQELGETWRNMANPGSIGKLPGLDSNNPQKHGIFAIPEITDAPNDALFDDSDLRAVVKAWRNLAETARAEIMEIVKTAGYGE
jgi:integrase